MEQTVRARKGQVQSVMFFFVSHLKGKRRSTILLFGNRTFLVCSLAVVIHGAGLRTHLPLAWNWLLQDEIERARVSFLAAMCQLLGEGVRKRGRVHAAGLPRTSWSLLVRGAGLVGWLCKTLGNHSSETTMHCTDLSI